MPGPECLDRPLMSERPTVALTQVKLPIFVTQPIQQGCHTEGTTILAGEYSG